MVLIVKPTHKPQIPAYIPQGLKPASILLDLCGTAKAVPFQNLVMKQPLVRISAAQVHEFDLAGGAAKKAGTEALELLDGIGSEAADLILRRWVLRRWVLR